MADKDTSVLPPPSAEQRRVAAGQFERANQVIATGNYDYGIKLLLSCCKLDPANLIYRQALRRTEKTKYQNNLRGHWLAWLTTAPAKAKIKAARRAHDWLKVLELGEQVLVRNPWDTGTQLAMGEAAETLGLLEVAIWTVDQARQKNLRDVKVNRTLAALFEKRGNFTQAMALWSLILKDHPGDVEAQQKAKDLAVSDTIARGHYEDVVSGQAPPRPGPEPAKAEAAPAAAPNQAPAAPAPPTTPATERGAREAASIRARIEADPTNANAYLQLAALHRRADHLDQARQALRQGLAATGNHFDLAVELLDLETEPFRRDLAVAEAKLRDRPDDGELRQLRTRLLKETNSRELDLFRKKADRYPTDMGHRFELGVRLLRAGQVDEAIHELQTTRADPRHQWRSLLYLGYCFKGRNNWRLAKRNFEEALRHMPPAEQGQRKEVLFQLAQGSAEAGDLAAAVEVGHELANLDFLYRDIGRLLDEWQTRLASVGE